MMLTVMISFGFNDKQARVFDKPIILFMLQRLNDCLGMGRNGKPSGNPVGMGIGRKIGNGSEWECKKPFPVISVSKRSFTNN